MVDVAGFRFDRVMLCSSGQGILYESLAKNKYQDCLEDLHRESSKVI